MKTAYYRIKPGHMETIHADMLSDEEQRLIQKHNLDLFCPACAERVFFSQASTGKKPGEKGYRTAHFKHQMKQNCTVEDCDLRVDGSDKSVYISQRLRTPLFLRPGPNGFVLSAGFSTADKESMRRLQERHFKKLVIHNGRDILTQASLDDTSSDENIIYVNLPDITNRKMTIKMSVINNLGQALRPSHANKDWSDTMDWFTERRGAMFQYSAGNAGEKLPAGSYIKAHRPYLIVDKNTTAGNSFIKSNRLQELSSKYRFTYEHKGNLVFGNHNNYDVHLIVLPLSTEVDPKDYESLFEYIREHFAVILCDELAETRPLWPPASRKGDAYAIQPTSTNFAFLLASGVDPSANICLHRNYEEKPARLEPLMVYNNVTIGSIPLRTTRTHITIENQLSGNVASYRAETFRNPPPHGISINHTEQYLDAPGTYDLPLPDNKKLTLSGSCPFTAYHNGNKLYVPTGAVQTIDVNHSDTVLILTDTGRSFELKITHKTTVITNDNNISRNTNKFERYETRSRYQRY